jgi:hypothetical protein
VAGRTFGYAGSVSDTALVWPVKRGAAAVDGVDGSGYVEAARREHSWFGLDAAIDANAEQWSD